MRSFTINNSGITGTMQYPDVTVFAFNTNVITFAINTTNVSKVVISSGGKSINAQIYSGKATINISRLLQIGFDNPRVTRYISASVSVAINGISITSVSFNVIWGSINLSDQINRVAPYIYNPILARFERHVRWFTNYPQKLYVFNGSGWTSTTPTASTNTITYALSTSTFGLPMIWDANSGKSSTRPSPSGNGYVILRRDNRCTGYFLRWIDNLGHYQYFCFAMRNRTYKTESENTTKTAVIANGVAVDAEVESKTNEYTIPCAAIDVDQYEIGWVQTIATSPIVDMYLGKDASNNEVWMPVKVYASTYTIDEKKTQQDYEIKLSIPTNDAQKL